MLTGCTVYPPPTHPPRASHPLPPATRLPHTLLTTTIPPHLNRPPSHPPTPPAHPAQRPFVVAAKLGFQLPEAPAPTCRLQAPARFSFVADGHSRFHMNHWERIAVHKKRSLPGSLPLNVTTREAIGDLPAELPVSAWGGRGAGQPAAGGGRMDGRHTQHADWAAPRCACLLMVGGLSGCRAVALQQLRHLSSAALLALCSALPGRS